MSKKSIPFIYDMVGSFLRPQPSSGHARTSRPEKSPAKH